MKYFVIFSLLIFLGMMLYLDIIKYVLPNKEYWEGISIVPIVLVSFIFQGIFFNLSLWYKLTDKTMYGAWFSVLGTVIIVVGNVLLVPKFGYTGSAWSAFACYFVIMLVSYYFGQKHMPIKYDLKTIGLYTLLTIAIFIISIFIKTPYPVVNYALKTILLAIFFFVLLKRDFPIKSIPYIQRFINK
jgi:O-antigen/teichoic acid export membrane protein